jgi:putative salt-induced outer membrane protein
MKSRLAAIIALLIIAAPVIAAEQEAPVSPWAGKARLGYLATSGNTDNSNLNTAFEIGYSAGSWVHAFDAAAIFATEDSATTAEAYAVGWKSERALSEVNFLYGRLDWRKDRFSGYDQQFAQTVGYGRHLIDTERHSLNGEIGFGARQSDLADGTEESETILTGGLYYKWILSETATFTQDLAVESGSTNTYMESKTALSARLVRNLALVASYTVKSNSEVPVGTEKTDTFTALSLEYAF